MKVLETLVWRSASVCWRTDPQAARDDDGMRVCTLAVASLRPNARNFGPVAANPSSGFFFRFMRGCALCWLAHRQPGGEGTKLGNETVLRCRSSRPGPVFIRRRAFQAGPAAARLRHEPRNDVGIPSAPHAHVASRMSRNRRRNAALSKAAVAYFQRRPVMSSQEDIAAMQVRIAKAESERDSWRVSGMQEKYLEAYSMVEALELQLERLRQAART
jgi:hypothetical protein